RTPGSVALRDGITDYLARLATSPIDDLPDSDPSFSNEAIGITRRFL
ncbi:MAG: hypothetical protein GWN79_13365, partial [Actinobacteria bacterium]|nr:hypothetical protein [Actinomycetota bacterium]NIS34474.1 hypothetical protein [Actinomycetota bacterium]NIT97513.1 hypothetical protein [Actinomycetota bacterium]NIU20012.1 hypothetical protein [Actinomycetota bacterium]NIU69244.1 hypothetical protein [Actinomycetota bacterium]